MRRGTIGDVFKMVCFDRRMDRAARLRVNQGESEGPVSAEAPPWQGVFVLADACRGVVERSRKSADLTRDCARAPAAHQVFNPHRKLPLACRADSPATCAKASDVISETRGFQSAG